MSYELTGNRHMGAAMKKKQSYLNEWKIKARRKIMPGFPIEKPFETRQQIDDYLNSDRLICLLCGKTFKSLCSHLHIHGTNADDYKQKYGLPLGAGLTCITTKIMNIAHGKRLVADGIFKPPTPEEHAFMIANSSKPRPKPSYVLKEATLRITGKQLDKLFTDAHYLKILEIAENNNCHPTDVCRKNKGKLPSLTMLHKYNREHSDYRHRYHKIIHNLPQIIKVSHGIRCIDVDKIKQLKNERKTNAEIAIILNVHEITIEKYNKKYGIKKPLPTTCKSGLHLYPGFNKHCQPCNTINSRKLLGTMDRAISKTIWIDRECTDCKINIKVKRIYGSIKIKYCDICKKKRYYESQNKYAKEKRKLLILRDK